VTFVGLSKSNAAFSFIAANRKKDQTRCRVVFKVEKECAIKVGMGSEDPGWNAVRELEFFIAP
jgi:hypothetical protein